MPAEADITDDDLEEAFRAGPQFGLEFLDAECKEYLFRFIKCKARSLGPDDIAEVYQETMRSLVEEVQKPSFDPAQPMRLVHTIAERRAYDALRKKGYRARISLDDALPHIARDLKDSRLEFEWRLHPDDWSKFRTVLDRTIDGLPEKQRIAAHAFLDVYEDVREQNSYLSLAERIREVTGEDVTTAQAKDRWREARTTIAEKLTRAGLKILLED